jgi:outer membrane protein assembly factor BamB
VLAKGRIYLTTATEANGLISLELSILNAKSGEILKRQQIFEHDAEKAPGHHSKNSNASPTPILSGDRVYLHFGHLGTACVRASDAKVVWKNDKLAYRPVHGNGSSPVLVDGVLVFTADGASDPLVIALDAETGDVRWKYPRPEIEGKQFSFATPLVIEVDGQKQIIAPGAGSVSALRPSDGGEIWRVHYADGYSVIPRPVFAHGLVFLSSGYDDAVAIAIRPTGSGDTTKTHVAWRREKGAPHTPSMLVVGDELYMISDGGIATCLDAKTGEQHWQQRIGGNFSASPVLADGKIYLQAEDGKGTVIAPGKKYRKLGENGFGERALASYGVGDGAIFVRTEKALYRVEQ